VSGSLRIAVVHPFSWPEVRRGGERYLDDLVWYLTEAGHAVDVVTGTTGPSSETVRGRLTERRRRNVVPPRLSRRNVSPVDTFGLAALRPLLRRRYDVVHALTPTAALAARLAGHRTVYTVLGHPTEEQFGRRPLDRRLVAAAVRVASTVTALSHASAGQVEAMFGRRADVLSPGVRVRRFPAKEGPPPGEARILFSADASDGRKGVALALEAIVEVAERRPGARLALSGSGDHRWALAQLGGAAEQIDALTDVLGPGAPDDVPRRYRDATVTVLPARDEAFGLALVESLASGTPVVCSKDGGMPEIVDDPCVGVTFSPRNAAALAGAIHAAIDLAADQGTSGRCARHARRWDWETVVGPAHEACYRGLVARRRATPS
jgi:glycosyltransferase involved in cell wall biosynthesis